MISWEMPDGSEVRYEGLSIEVNALREFVLRFMSSHNGWWDTNKWDDRALATDFERRFGEKVEVKREHRPNGFSAFIIRPLLQAT